MRRSVVVKITWDAPANFDENWLRPGNIALFIARGCATGGVRVRRVDIGKECLKRLSKVRLYTKEPGADQ